MPQKNNKLLLENTLHQKDFELLRYLLGVVLLGVFLFADFSSISRNIAEEVKEDFEISHTENILATSWYVFDGKKVVSEKNSNTPYPLASLIKPFTLLTVLPYTKDTITISRDAVREKGDSRLREGDTYTKEELSTLALHHSSNDAIYALRENTEEDVFTASYNLILRELSLSSFFTSNNTGLDMESRAAVFGNAKDIDTTMRVFAFNYPEIAKVSTKNILNIRDLSFENTNPIVENFKSLTLSKTGYTDESGGNLVLLFENGASIVILGSTFNERFSDAWYLYEKYINSTL
ncbi:MAG: D-alanyl-D-alanine carboxypeptidase [Flavobacteriaceae bacterium]|jgi:D-alanyl-D-alanine carboxypeptidase